MIPRFTEFLTETEVTRINIPFFFDAAILSRIRSAVTSRWNCAMERRALSVSRPIEDVVLNCCVSETKEPPCASSRSTIFAKSAGERVSRSEESRPGPRHTGDFPCALGQRPKSLAPIQNSAFKNIDDTGLAMPLPREKGS